MPGRYALLIGINNYHKTYQQLKAPEDEMNDLAELLQKKGGFEVKIADRKDDAGLKTIITEFFDYRTPEDMLLFYFAGHGSLGRKGEFYFIAENTVKGKEHVNGIKASFVLDDMELSRSEKQIIILDCCFSGAFGLSKGDIDNKLINELKGEGEMGRYIIASSAETSLSWEVTDEESNEIHSIFTHVLINGIKTFEADLDNNGKITIEELFNYIKRNMKSMHQVPNKNVFAEGDLIIAIKPEILKEQSYDKELLEALFQSYSRVIKNDFVAVFLINSEGVIITQEISKLPSTDEIIDYIRTSVISISKKTPDPNSIETFTLDKGEFRYLFCQLLSNIIFVSVLDGLADIDQVLPYFYLCAEKINRIIYGDSVIPVIPKPGEIKESDGDVDLTKSLKTNGSVSASLKRRSLANFERHYVIKIVILGDHAVGKTSLIYRYIKKKFRVNLQSTLGANLSKKNFMVDGVGGVSAQIWDLGGQRVFRSLRSLYCEGANGGIIIFDVTRWKTFNSVREWYEDAQKTQPKLNIILIGNKIDLKKERKIPKSEAIALARSLGVKYIETSALTGKNIEFAFQYLAKQILKDSY